ncbi:hypothetical protein MH928_13585 [Flavobacterium sp. WW92]|uniref:nSTAND3 domain-containing NTPase n=1 Tax=unclassified Flavobacterium TaxID=196869 RepID=UPI002224C2B1|nr:MULTISPECIES: hypothetical protein [unclassified Flavobacterium]WDO12352.1 hypothetical protein MH928_13585 [Flavobacterium sp. WW92]
MQKRTFNKFLALGFPTDLINKIGIKSLTVSGLQNQSKQALEKAGFSKEEVALIREKVNRAPIAVDTIANILAKSGGICAICADGYDGRPYQIHHMEEYHITQDHSESNLMLLCPTHHVIVHKEAMSLAEQYTFKRKWEHLWEIALFYNKNGVSFPFGTFVYIDYEQQGNITEIFSFGSPSPFISATLSRGAFAQKATETLQSSSCLIIAGSSGSGKTTLALGIAGMQSDRKTFKAFIDDTNLQQSIHKIFYFLSQTVGKITLIVDDANSIMNSAQIEELLKAATSSRWIIIINTRNDFAGDSNIEQHFLNSVVFLDWPRLKGSVIVNILENEHHIVQYLKEHKLDGSDHDQIGFSEFTRPLKNVVHQFANTAGTVWEFIFLLGGGIDKATDLQHELKAYDRFDILFFYIAMKHISTFERGVSIDELLLLYRYNSVLKGKGVPEKGWLEDQLSRLCSKRMLKMERGRYKTVHRQFARKYISSFYPYHREISGELLDMIFKDSTLIREIANLWSWLRGTEVGSYLRNWYNPEVTSWAAIVRAASIDDIQTLGGIADMMHTVHPKFRDGVIADSLRGIEDIIAAQINKSDFRSLSAIGKIVTLIRYHATEIFGNLLPLIDKMHFIGMVKNAEPYQFDSLGFLFYGIYESNPEWIREVREDLNYEDFQRIVGKLNRGDISSLMEVVSFFRNGLSFRKSHLEFVVDTIKKLLKDCPLEEMDIPLLNTGLFELNFYDHHLEDILSVLDIRSLAIQLQQATPRHWKKISALGELTRKSGSRVIKQIVMAIDGDILIENIKRYYEGSQYEFRILIYFLAYGNTDTRNWYSTALEPLVDNYYRNLGTKKDYSSILEAYSCLSKEKAEVIAERYGRTDQIDKTDIREDKDYAKQDKIIKEYIQQLDQTGEDYELSIFGTL